MTLKITPERVGWLLTCKAPENIAKGKKLLATLTTKDRKEAKDRSKTLAALYKGKGDHETRIRLSSYPNPLEGLVQ